MAARIMFTITNTYGAHPVSYSLYHLIVRLCRKNTYQAHKLFWDARDKQDPAAYIRKKIKNGWLTDTVAMDYNKQQMEAWIDQVIYKKKMEKKPLREVDIKKESTVEPVGKLLADVLKSVAL